MASLPRDYTSSVSSLELTLILSVLDKAIAETPKSRESSNIDMSKLIYEMSKLSSPSFSSYHLPTFYNISSLFIVPMDHTNYLSWKSQIEDILEMHGLTSVINNNTKPLKMQEDGYVHP
ncbi:hypothetical protein SADUNF_Sadunf06G0103900 [Salix dunnii]|uniref:Retrotransposon Copia-like N-terminal domain-containing protein n=1 Tax=Salix dunnii TaxID=1413687 RepID=A0A835N0I9_9ROSI|nr:hypothetical protein SADUNF_Sadunf06G0103900 [Salix dunnii]